MRKHRLPALLMMLHLVFFVSLSAVNPKRTEVVSAMMKATDFMMNTVSTNGGFVWKYSLDLSIRYGEVKARNSMVWVEPPGTPTVGEMLIEAWLVTGDDAYKHYAEHIAETVIKGQLSCGGWHYFIDLDTIGLQEYYRDYLSTIWGWEEHLKYYGNATFDDETTVAATRFLLRLYAATQNERYRRSVHKALSFILDSQFPNGGWPQRSPALKVASDGEETAYTQYATFNDDVIHNNIMLLLESWNTLKDGRYRESALRGMDFFILSQFPPPQSGWAQQYNHRLQPAPGRKFEIGTVCAGETVTNIGHLLDYYRYTGDRRYLEPIPRALQWLEKSAGKIPLKHYSHTYYYEMGSNKPVYMHVKGEKQGRHFVQSYQFDGAYPYGLKLNINTSKLRQEYSRIASLTPVEARMEFDLLFDLQRRQPIINLISSGLDYRTTAKDSEEVRLLIGGLDSRGGWVVQNEILDEQDFIHNPPNRFYGYDTGTYVTRMYRLINFLRDN